MTAKTRAEQLAEKTRRLKAVQADAKPATPPAVEAPEVAAPDTAAAATRPTRSKAATQPLVKDVRLTVDLPPARYRDLQGWLNDAAVQLGRSRVTKQDALAALVALLLRDDVIARKVLSEIKASQ